MLEEAPSRCLKHSIRQNISGWVWGGKRSIERFLCVDGKTVDCFFLIIVLFRDGSWWSLLPFPVEKATGSFCATLWGVQETCVSISIKFWLNCQWNWKGEARRQRQPFKCLRPESDKDYAIVCKSEYEGRARCGSSWDFPGALMDMVLGLLYWTKVCLLLKG